MIKQYFKQAISQLKENRLISVVSVVGTALAISMIMVIVIVLQVRLADYMPEVNRSRSLYVKAMSVHEKGDNSFNSSNGCMSLRTAKECFKALATPEAVTVTSVQEQVRLAVPAGKRMTADKVETDDAFWQVFQFEFLCGKPFEASDCTSGLSKAVITASVARKLFGTTDVAGRVIQLNHADYTITGVVKDVSKLATSSYAQVWIPYTSTEIASMEWYEHTMGMMRVIILAHSASDFPAIRAEAESLRQKYNAGLSYAEVFYRGQPDDRFAYIYRHWGETLNLKSVFMKYTAVILILLLVPAINLSSMTLSRMRKRMAEIGVRKAFGASKGELLQQVFMENLILTLIAGVLGLVLSYVATFLLNDFLFSSTENAAQLGETSLTMGMLLDPVVFLLAFVFCLMMNLLSAGIPAYRASQMSITDALNQK